MNDRVRYIQFPETQISVSRRMPILKGLVSTSTMDLSGARLGVTLWVGSLLSQFIV